MTQAYNLSQFANFLNTSGQASLTTAVTGTLPIANGGTNNASLGVTAGGVYYGDGSKIVQIGAGTSGQILQSNGTGAPTWVTFTGGATISDDTTTNATRYPLYAAATSGTLSTAYTSSTEYKWNPSTGELTAPEVIASNGIVVNSATVSASYSIPSGSNAMSVGPVSVASGQTVTVPSGSNWVIL